MITSTANTKMKRLIRLQQKQKAREAEQVFLAEGVRMAREVPKERLQELYVSESFAEKEALLLQELTEESGCKTEVLSDPVFAHVSDTKSPQGILLVVAETQHDFRELLAGKGQTPPLLLLLEQLQDPGNLGTLLRSAEAAGVTGVVMSRDTADIYQPKTVRATMGSIFRVPFCTVDVFSDALKDIKAQGISIYAAHLKGCLAYDEADYRKPCAIMIGNEGNGLSREAALQADLQVRIPMAGSVDSLNAAVAGSVLLFEAGRQRKQPS